MRVNKIFERYSISNIHLPNADNNYFRNVSHRMENSKTVLDYLIEFWQF